MSVPEVAALAVRLCAVRSASGHPGGRYEGDGTRGVVSDDANDFISLRQITIDSSTCNRDCTKNRVRSNWNEIFSGTMVRWSSGLGG
jgi:hypothetical protein